MPEYDTPLGLVQRQLWHHTDLYPTDEAAVADMIREAVATLDDPADFETRLKKSLNPEEKGGLGTVGATAIESLGALVTNNNAEHAQQWGSLSLLGALAMTYNRQTVRNGEDMAAFRAQASAQVARKELVRIAIESSDKQQRKLAGAFLRKKGVRTEDVAAVLELYGIQKPDGEDMPAPAEDEPGEREIISQPRDSVLVASDDKATSQIESMVWLTCKPSAGETPVREREVLDAGTVVARVYDFTVFHTTLDKHRLELDGSGVGRLFWKRLGVAILRDATNTRSRPLEDARAPIQSFGNRGAKDHTLTRGYYMHLGKDPLGVKLYALVAAGRTKRVQRDILNIISIGARS